MLFDKTEKRLREASRQIPQNIDRIAELKARGTEWWIRYKDAQGRPHDEKVPEQYAHTKTGANQFYEDRKSQVRAGTAPMKEAHVRIDAVLKYFRENKNKSADTRTIHKRLSKVYGWMHLDKVNELPEHLVKPTRKLFEDMSPKYAWNHWVKLKAAIGLWNEMHGVVKVNPCIIVGKTLKLKPGTQKRNQCPTRVEFEHLLEVCTEQGVDREAILLLEAVWESGLRIGEVLQWRIEGLSLKVVVDEVGNVLEVPYFTATIEKQEESQPEQFPMSVRLWEILKEMVAGLTAGYVWSWRNPPYKVYREHKVGPAGVTNGVTRETVNVFEEAGLGDYRPFHDYRKSWKVGKKLAGYGSEFTQALQGHKTDAMDRYYTVFKRLDTQKAYAGEYASVTKRCDQTQRTGS